MSLRYVKLLFSNRSKLIEVPWAEGLGELKSYLSFLFVQSMFWNLTTLGFCLCIEVICKSLYSEWNDACWITLFWNWKTRLEYPCQCMGEWGRKNYWGKLEVTNGSLILYIFVSISYSSWVFFWDWVASNSHGWEKRQGLSIMMKLFSELLIGFWLRNEDLCYGKNMPFVEAYLTLLLNLKFFYYYFQIEPIAFIPMPEVSLLLATYTGFCDQKQSQWKLCMWMFYEATSG